jgi:hypothetical protein
VLEQRAEVLALQRHQVLLVTSEPASTSPPQITSAIRPLMWIVVRADEAAVAHVASWPMMVALPSGRPPGRACARRAPAGVEHRLGLRDGDEQQLVLVRHDDVVVEQVAELARLDRAGAHLGHRRGGEAFAENGKQVGIGIAGRRHLGRRGARCRSARRRRAIRPTPTSTRPM